jgi:hypothetical protein
MSVQNIEVNRYSLFSPLVFVKHAQEFDFHHVFSPYIRKSFLSAPNLYSNSILISIFIIVEIRMSNCSEMASQVVVKRKALPKR